MMFTMNLFTPSSHLPMGRAVQAKSAVVPVASPGFAKTQSADTFSPMASVSSPNVQRAGNNLPEQGGTAASAVARQFVEALGMPSLLTHIHQLSTEISNLSQNDVQLGDVLLNMVTAIKTLVDEQAALKAANEALQLQNRALGDFNQFTSQYPHRLQQVGNAPSYVTKQLGQVFKALTQPTATDIPSDTPLQHPTLNYWLQKVADSSLFAKEVRGVGVYQEAGLLTGDKLTATTLKELLPHLDRLLERLPEAEKTDAVKETQNTVQQIAMALTDMPQRDLYDYAMWHPEIVAKLKPEAERIAAERLSPISTQDTDHFHFNNLCRSVGKQLIADIARLAMVEKSVNPS